MDNILSDLFYGRLLPGEKYCVNGQEIWKLLAKTKQIRCNLYETLSESQRMLFQEYERLTSEANVLVSEDYFIGGYRLGARMTIEVFADRHF